MLSIRAAVYDAFFQTNEPEHRGGARSCHLSCPGLCHLRTELNPMKLGLEGKTAVITAASGGIGSGIAAALADAGVHVAISGRTSTALEKVAARLASCSGG